MSNNNAGEASDYTFTFKSDTGYAIGETIEITFPTAFDPFVGHSSVWLAQEPGVYYMNCHSTALSLTWCTVDKWKVTISGSAAVEAANEIDITLEMVMNPMEQTTTQKLKLAIVDATGAFKSINIDFANSGVIIAAPPADNIAIASVMASNHELFANSVSYTFDFYLEDTSLDTDENLYVMFPMNYDLHLCDGVSEYTCSTELVESTGDIEDWNTDTSCAADGNWVMLDAKAYTLETTDRFEWEIDSVGNPEAAMTRTAATAWDFDATDSSLFTLYGGWTGKFEMFTYDLSDKTYTARSYGNLNAAYVGFDYGYDQIEVNSGTRVTVWAGSYSSDISIKASTNGGMLASEKVTLSPTTNSRSRKNPESKIAFKSAIHNYIFYGEVNEIMFRVGADINLTKGLYYIDWSITEVGHGGNNVPSTHYHAPAKTMVEVVAAVTNKYSFSVEGFSGGNTYKGTNSPDIGVSVSNAPFTDVTVNLALLGGTNEHVSFEPSTLTFGPDDLIKYF